jgi:site-specific recombinase XerD
MFEQLFCDESALARHRAGPFAEERERYLQRCAEHGATRAALRVKANELLWLCQHLPRDASQGIDLPALREIARERRSVCKGATTERRLVDIGRPWLRFLGWWRVPTAELRFQSHLEQYVTWMRDERGFSSSTITQWRSKIRDFLQWYERTDRPFCGLEPSDVDVYFVTEGAPRWSRVSTSGIAAALRVFFRYMANCGECDPRVADAIRGPRLYAQESLPSGPAWSNVQRMLVHAGGDSPADVRDRAILMLLAIYGMRSGEVRSLRLDQIDWPGRVLRIFRLKRRQPQVYPLLQSVAEAVSRYIDAARPKAAHPEIFLGLLAPHGPLSSGAMSALVRHRFMALGIQALHRGPHALRHACAARLVAEGLTMKEIGDHLGHRTTRATGTYAKIDLLALREVGDFDLGDLE